MARCLVFAIVLAAPPAFGAEKLPVPPDAALESPLAVIKEIYGDEHANAKTNEQLQALAKKLFSVASKAGNPIERFALLRVARDIAIQASDGPMAFQIIDEMDRTFDVDAVTMKASVLYALAKKARLPAERKSIAKRALALVDLALGRDDFELSDKLADMALAEARKARDVDYVKSVVGRTKEIEKLRIAYTQVKAAAKTLEESPADTEANLVMGRYRCLVKGDWENGLPMLALGSDAVLKDLAQKELGELAKPEQQAELGDSWWEMAEGEEGTHQAQLRRRAIFWYQKALPRLTGLAQAKVKRRLETTHDMVVEETPTSVGHQAYLADLRPEKVVMGGQSDDKYMTPIAIAGSRCDHGLHAHPAPQKAQNAFSYYRFNLDGSYHQLQGVAGMKDGMPQVSKTPLTFRVLGDGKLLWQSRPMRIRGDWQSFQVGMKGVSSLELYVDCPGPHNYAWSVWGDLVLKK